MSRRVQRWLFDFLKEFIILWLADRVSAYALTNPEAKDALYAFLQALEEELNQPKHSGR